MPLSGSYKALKRLCLLFLVIMLGGCNGQTFQIKNLAKTDVDMVTDAHIQEVDNLTKQLLIKLYKRNPRELAKKTGMSIDKRIQQLFSMPRHYRFKELDRKTGTGAIKNAFDEDFRGDRVFALMVGIKSMVHAAFDEKMEFFMLDEINQQQLYHSARNLEIVNWRLNNYRKAEGSLFLLSNGYEHGVANLSFERLFGKMIALQDMMARIVADSTNRTINTVIHSVASTTLFPIGI